MRILLFFIAFLVFLVALVVAAIIAAVVLWLLGKIFKLVDLGCGIITLVFGFCFALVMALVFIILM